MSDEPETQPEPEVTTTATPEKRLERNLSLIAAMAKRAGAEGIFVLRSVGNPVLAYELGDADLAPLEMSIATCPTLLIIRFDQSDGGEAGIEHF